MKRHIAAAALAAAAFAAAAPAGAQPILSEYACGVGQLDPVGGDDSCRFIASANTLGFAGAVSGGYTLTHRETVAECVANKIVVSTVTKTDKTAGAGPVAEPQYKFIAGITYTIKMTGSGGILVGGPSGGTPSPTAAEPAERPLDATGGKKAGDVC